MTRLSGRLWHIGHQVMKQRAKIPEYLDGDSDNENEIIQNTQLSEADSTTMQSHSKVYER